MKIENIVVARDEDTNNILIEIVDGLNIEVVLKDDSLLKGSISYVEDDKIGLDMSYINDVVEIDFDYIKSVKGGLNVIHTIED